MNMVIWHLPFSRPRVATLTLHNSGNPGWCDTVASQEIATSIWKAPFPLEIKHTVTVLEQNPAARSARWSLDFPICTRHTGPILHRCNVVVSLCLPSGEVKYSSLDWNKKKKKRRWGINDSGDQTPDRKPYKRNRNYGFYNLPKRDRDESSARRGKEGVSI